MRKVLHLMGILTEEDLEWLFAHGHVRFIPPGTTLIRQGEPVEAIFILLDGKLSVQKVDINDREVAVLYPGEIVGEISFVDTRAPSAAVVSAKESHVFAVEKDVLAAKLSRDVAFSARFYRALAMFLADRLRATTSHLGYGKWQEEADADEIDESRFDDISLAARRFDGLLQRLRVN